MQTNAMYATTQKKMQPKNQRNNTNTGRNHRMQTNAMQQPINKRSPKTNVETQKTDGEQELES